MASSRDPRAEPLVLSACVREDDLDAEGSATLAEGAGAIFDAQLTCMLLAGRKVAARRPRSTRTGMITDLHSIGRRRGASYATNLQYGRLGDRMPPFERAK